MITIKDANIYWLSSPCFLQICLKLTSNTWMLGCNKLFSLFLLINYKMPVNEKHQSDPFRNIFEFPTRPKYLDI